MTRKEELKQRAITIVDEFPVCFETETEKKEYQEYAFDMLRKVEREVWEKVIDESNKKASSILISNEQQPFCDGFRAGAHNMALWCKAQQQELT